jgi:HlyD family type I secretion membrane fusion protein
MSKALTFNDRFRPVVAYVQKGSAAIVRHFERSNEVVAYSEAMIDPKKPLRSGAIIIFVTFFVFGTWAAFAPLDSAAVAPGVAVVESNRRIIQHLEGGIVDDILVQEGSKVKNGDVLVRLDDTRARAQVAILQNEVDNLLAMRARLVAERDGLSAPQFPAELLARDNDPEIKDLIEGQRSLFRVRAAAVGGQKLILEQRVQEYQEQITGTRALQQSKEAQLADIRDELNGLTGLLAQGYVTKSRVLALKREEARLQGEAGNHLAEIARSEQGIGEAKLQILQIEKAHQEEVAKELRDTETKIAEGRERLVTANDVMRRIDVASPVDGTVMNLQIHSKGGVVSPGQAMMEVIPDKDSIIVEVQISPTDVGTVHPGDQVTLHVNSVDARLAPMIFGTLETITADRMTDQRTGMPYYKGRVTISPEQLARLGNVQLHSGMSVEAMIKSGEQTALQYALKPLLNRMHRAFKER